MKYWCPKTSASWALWQSSWKINSPEFWHVADNSCILKWNLFIATSFTNVLYQFSILFVIISRRFFLVKSNNFIKSLWNVTFYLHYNFHLVQFCKIQRTGHSLVGKLMDFQWTVMWHISDSLLKLLPHTIKTPTVGLQLTQAVKCALH